MSIPKVIHYCWFGQQEMPDTVKKCIRSWEKQCPDYKIIRWDETNFDVKKYTFTKDAYEMEKWSFVSDVARLDIIYNEGGIYLDTDVELIRGLDDFLDDKCFMGFENDEYVATGLGFGAEKGNEIVKANLDAYLSLRLKGQENISSLACPIITSELLKKKGFKMDGSLQRGPVCSLYPKEFFCPMDYATGKIVITENTYSIHHYDAAWKSDSERRQNGVEQKLNRVSVRMFGRKNGVRISRKLAKVLCKLGFVSGEVKK